MVTRVLVPPAPPDMDSSESSFQQLVEDLARVCGWLVYHTRDSRRSEAGYPDLTLVRGDVAWFIELKTRKGRLSPAQRVWGEALAAAGLRYACWRPGDWDEIVATLTSAR